MSRLIFNCFIIRDFRVHIRKPTLSQRLIDLAQRVDFREAAGEEGSEPASKKPVKQWPWQQANSKLR